MKKKAYLEEKGARKDSDSQCTEVKKKVHNINKPVTLEDLTNPDKED